MWSRAAVRRHHPGRSISCSIMPPTTEQLELLSRAPTIGMAADVVGGNMATENKLLDANRYATKKTIAQGMLDIALLTANASQLKYILQVGDRHEFYSLMVTLISASILLQVGLGMVFLSLNLMRDCKLHLVEYRQSALFINYCAVAASFAVTVLNVLISAFDPGLGSMAALADI